MQPKDVHHSGTKTEHRKSPRFFSKIVDTTFVLGEDSQSLAAAALITKQCLAQPCLWAIQIHDQVTAVSLKNKTQALFILLPYPWGDFIITVP